MIKKIKKIILNQQEIEFELILKKRKSLSLQIKKPGILRVLSPEKFGLKRIENILLTHSNWIIEKLFELREKNLEFPPKKMIQGEIFYFSGFPCNLLLEFDGYQKNPLISATKQRITIITSSMDECFLRKELEKWYRKQTRKRVFFVLEELRKILQFEYNEVKIKSQKKRWGSCSSKGNLNFNWKLSMMPEWVSTYIVVHEVCHLIHLNHSKKFWNLVGSIYPDYIKCRKWLEVNGGLLEIE